MIEEHYIEDNHKAYEPIVTSKYSCVIIKAGDLQCFNKLLVNRFKIGCSPVYGIHYETEGDKTGNSEENERRSHF
jgi:hypothetical protein